MIPFLAGFVSWTETDGSWGTSAGVVDSTQV